MSVSLLKAKKELIPQLRKMIIHDDLGDFPATLGILGDVLEELGDWDAFLTRLDWELDLLLLPIVFTFLDRFCNWRKTQ